MVSFDLRDFQRAARSVDRFANQMPFAMAMALNKSIDVAKDHIVQETWPQHVHARNRTFMRAALVKRRATKQRLSAELYDRFGRGNLKLHDEGGKATGSGDMAIPSSAFGAKRVSRGMPQRLQPKNLPNSFTKVGKRGTTLILQRTGKYVRGTKKKAASSRQNIRLAYVLKPSNPVRADVPFHADFERVVRREMRRQFSAAMKKAMATAFKR